MESAPPAVKEKVWTRVLFYAMYMEEFDAGISAERPFDFRELNKKRMELLLVCKLFKVTIHSFSHSSCSSFFRQATCPSISL